MADTALIREALEYQEAHSLMGPLFPEAQEELLRLEERLETLQREREGIRRRARSYFIDYGDFCPEHVKFFLDDLAASSPASGRQ